MMQGVLTSQTLVPTDDEDMSNPDSYRSRRSHSVCHSRQNSSNCLNMLSSVTDPLENEASGAGAVHVRRSASGVFRYSHEEDGDEDEDEEDDLCDEEDHLRDNQFLIESGFKSDLNDYDLQYPEDCLFHTPRDPFNG